MMSYPSKEQERAILRQNIDIMSFENFKLKQILNPQVIIDMQELVKEIYIAPEIEEYIVSIVNTTRDKKFHYSRFIEWGASPRASISLFMASRAEAMLNGRSYVIPQDVKRVAHDILRHRILLNYEAEAEGMNADKIITEIINDIPIP